MRKVFLLACVSFVTMSGSAMAADCTRGMLWPYVRAAGDCLTDAEIAAGQKGAYSGPTNTNVDVSAIKPAQAPSQSGAPAPVGSVSRSDGALIETSVFGAVAPTKAVVECHRGILWPFQREPGDCLTAAEKRSGQTGYYGGVAAITQASANVAGPGAPAPSGAASQEAAPQTAPAPQAVSCSKSWFWPFVKEAGDCASAAGKAGTDPK